MSTRTHKRKRFLYSVEKSVSVLRLGQRNIRFKFGLICHFGRIQHRRFPPRRGCIWAACAAILTSCLITMSKLGSLLPSNPAHSPSAPCWLWTGRHCFLVSCSKNDVGVEFRCAKFECAKVYGFGFELILDIIKRFA